MTENDVTTEIRGGLSRREFLTGTLGVAAAAALAACSSPGASLSSATVSTSMAAKAHVDGDLYYFNWAQYIHPSLIKGFEKKYGVNVHQTYFSSNDDMMAKMASNVSYDAVIPVSHNMPRLIQGGLLRPIDKAQLQNWDQVIPYFQNPWFDPQAAHSIPYAMGPTGIAWRTDQVTDMKQSWNDLWDHPDAKGKIFVIDEAQEALGMSLLRLGFDINSSNPDEVGKAADALIQLKPVLAGFSANDQGNLLSGAAWIQHAWSGDVYFALQQAKNPTIYQYENPTNGTPFSANTVCIPTNAKHPGTATLFLDWLLQPDHAAKNVTYIGYPNGAKAGMDEFARLVKDFPWLNVTEDMITNANWFHALDGPAQQLWNSEWTRVKAS